ncbi:hypothetical protein FRC04_004943 [Tulasnella sp. 424]|nr:hypothetical protein FRC04_004943 [Tulasnella sp. 424]
MISPGYMQPFVRANQKSPILDLPHDLTYLIFFSCHRDNPQNFSTTIPRGCKQWRKAALAISELWSTINFDKNLKNKQVAEKIQLQLERAQLAPLHIHIFESAIHKPAIKNILKICQLMFPLVQQWGSLSIHGNVPHKALRLLFDRLTNTSVLRLENLAIENNMVMWHQDMAVKWRFKAFGSGMPSLRYFQLSVYRPDRNSHTFDNLIELEIQDPQLLTMKEDKLTTIVRDILIHSPRLRRLVITGPFTPKSWPAINRSRPPPTRDTIAHSAIKCINIVPHREGAVTDALLHLVEMPELEELTSDPSYYILPSSFHTLAHVNSAQYSLHPNSRL